jgi:hypothetical protein
MILLCAALLLADPERRKRRDRSRSSVEMGHSICEVVSTARNRQVCEQAAATVYAPVELLLASALCTPSSTRVPSATWPSAYSSSHDALHDFFGARP